MKKHLAVLIGLLVSTGAFAADSEPPPRTISVSGTAVGYMQADTVLWDIQTEADGDSLASAKTASDASVQKVAEICGRHGIAVADIAVGAVAVKDARVKQAEADPAGSRTFRLFRTITVRQRDSKTFTELLGQLGDQLNVRVKFTFVSSKSDQVARETLVRAGKAAQEKAAALASVLGSKLGRVLTINEYAPPGVTPKDADIPVDVSTPDFGANTRTICITVFCTFELQ